MIMISLSRSDPHLFVNVIRKFSVPAFSVTSIQSRQATDQVKTVADIKSSLSARKSQKMHLNVNEVVGLHCETKGVDIAIQG